MKQPKRILITRTDRLGDVVLSTPVISALRRAYPDAFLAFMVRPENRDVVDGDPCLNEVITYDKYGSEKSFVKTVAFSRMLRRKKFDVAIALHPTNRTHIMLFLAGIPDRIGYDRKMGWLLTRRVPHRKQEGTRHEVDYNLDLLAGEGIDVSGADRRPSMTVNDEDRRAVDAIIKEHGLGDNIIALHPGASCPSKRWPPERFAAAADRLAELYGADIAVTGGKETAAYSAAVLSAMKGKAADLTGLFSVGQLAAFLAGCRLFVSNDSGPVHVSVAVGTPVIAVFGRKDPGLSPLRWGPLGEKDVVLHRDVGCEICLAHNCEKDFACLKAVTVDDVVHAAKSILG